MKTINYKYFGTCILFLFSLLPSHAQDAFYIYRNDGNFNAHFFAEVDSMTCSRYDTNGTIQQNFVTQEIHTPDSTYRIPLEAIDSIVFVTPDIVYKEDVVKLHETTLLDYVTNVDSLTITLNKDIPNKLVPNKRQKLLLEMQTAKFPHGFAGIVKDVVIATDKILVECTQASMEDMYEQFYCAFDFVQQDETSNAKTKEQNIDGIIKRINTDFELPSISETVSLDQYVELVPDLISLGRSGGVSLDINPKLHVAGILVFNKNVGPYFNVTIKIDQEQRQKVTFAEKLAVEKKIHLITVRQWLIFPWLQVFGDCSFVPRVSGELSLSGEFYQRNLLIYNFDYNARLPEQNKPTCIVENLGHDTDIIVGGHAECQFGISREIGISLIDKLVDEISYSKETGLSISADAEIHMSDFANLSSQNVLYTSLNKDNNFHIQLYEANAINVGIKNFGTSLSETKPLGEPLLQCGLVPCFSNLSCKTSQDKTIVTATADISRDLLFAEDIGFAIYDESGQKVGDTKWYNRKYNNKKDFSSYSLAFDGLQENTNYTLYPVLNFLGYEMHGTPEYKFIINNDDDNENEDNPKVSVVTGDSNIKYLKRVFVDVSASGLSNISGSYKLGVVYGTDRDLNVDAATAVYSDAKADGTYTIDLETLEYYAKTYYYRACVVTDDSIYYGDVKSFTTRSKITKPTEGNPIDLGLSVKWASRNLGAADEFDAGDHYAWGDISPRYNFYKDDYEHNDLIGPLSDITCISGTEYDAAKAQWGGKYRMPTLEEVQELERECLKEYFYTGYWGTERADGYLFIGPNGNSIFIPYGDQIVDGVSSGGDNTGIYYTGTRYEYSYAVYMFELSTRPMRGLLGGYEGLMIRPVYGDIPENSTE